MHVPAAYVLATVWSKDLVDKAPIMHTCKSPASAQSATGLKTAVHCHHHWPCLNHDAYLVSFVASGSASFQPFWSLQGAGEIWLRLGPPRCLPMCTCAYAPHLFSLVQQSKKGFQKRVKKRAGNEKKMKKNETQNEKNEKKMKKMKIQKSFEI